METGWRMVGADAGDRSSVGGAIWHLHRCACIHDHDDDCEGDVDDDDDDDDGKIPSQKGLFLNKTFGAKRSKECCTVDLKTTKRFDGYHHFKSFS